MDNISVQNLYQIMELVLRQLRDLPLSTMEIIVSLGKERIPAVEIDMPDGESKFLYVSLPNCLEKTKKFYEMSEGQGIYHHVKPSAAYAVQPRRTLCYSYTYSYSKTIHPVEPETPLRIQKLYDVTNQLFGYSAGEGVNMDLVNFYGNGRCYISKHSDDERQFGRLKDVYCWVFGPAARLGIFRDKVSEEPVLSLQIPEGLYVMQGRSFQQNYTHEFPELHPALFKRLTTKLVGADGFPDEVPTTELGASQKGMVQADWIKKNKNVVREFIASGGVSQGKKIQSDLANFEEWCLDRTSHTLRQFVA